MKCPGCVKEGKKSRVYMGSSMGYPVHVVPHYDENGNFVAGDIPVSRYYSCSNGHNWCEHFPQGEKKAHIVWSDHGEFCFNEEGKLK